jgi:hypothetical protein
VKPKPKSLGQVAMDSVPGGTLYNDATWSRAARAVIREHERRQWRPVSVRPRKTGMYLVCYEDRIIREWYYLKGCSVMGFSGATHWRPMPKMLKRK